MRLNAPSPLTPEKGALREDAPPPRRFLRRFCIRPVQAIKKPALTSGLVVSGGERGIRTPVTVFAVNMISNHAPSTTRTPLQMDESPEPCGPCIRFCMNDTLTVYREKPVLSSVRSKIFQSRKRARRASRERPAPRAAMRRSRAFCPERLPPRMTPASSREAAPPS